MFSALEQKISEINLLIEHYKKIIDEQNKKIDQQNKIINDLTARMENEKIQFITKKEVKDAINAGVINARTNKNIEFSRYNECQSYYSLCYLESFGCAILGKLQ